MRWLVGVVQNHNLAAVEIAEPFHKVKAKSTQSILMGYYNLGYFS